MDTGLFETSTNLMTADQVESFPLSLVAVRLIQQYFYIVFIAEEDVPNIKIVTSYKNQYTAGDLQCLVIGHSHNKLVTIVRNNRR